MKITLTIEQLLKAFSFRVTKQGEKGVAPIDVLNQVPFNALASNRANAARKKIKPIVDTYFETFNQKQKEKESLSVDTTEKYGSLIDEFKEKNGEDADVTDLNTKLNAELFEIERRINGEINELLKEENELDIHQIKLSDFKIDPNGDNDDSHNWHSFKGECFDFLDWLIVDDIDIPDKVDSEEIEVVGLEEAISETAEK